MQVGLDTGRLAELGLPATALADAIRSAGADLPAGEIHSGARRFNIEAGGAFSDLDQIRQIAVRSNSGAAVRVSDIAAVDWADPPRDHITRANDKRALFVTVEQKDGPALIERLRERLSVIPDAQFVIAPFTNGPPIDAPIEFSVVGPELQQLKRLASEMERVVRETPGARDVRNSLAIDRVDLDIGLDLEKAASLNVAPGVPRQAIRLALEGQPTAELRDEEGDSYDVVVSLPGTERRDIEEFEKIYVPTRAGAAVPLNQIASPELVSTPAQIERLDLQRSATVTAEVTAGFLTSRVNEEALNRVNQIEFPPGYSVIVQGEAEASASSFDGIGQIALLSFFAVLIVLAIEFGNMRLVTISLGVIPLGMFGGLIALFVTGNSLSYTAIIGFIALIGIEIKNSVLLVDFTRQLQDEGVELREAIEQAGEIRFLPVLLTAVTAIGGLLPLALGGAELYSPLAWVLIGGLVSSTVLSRVVTPVLYLLIEGGWRGKPTAPPTPEPEAKPAA